jgi:hypothetical protein
MTMRTKKPVYWQTIENNPCWPKHFSFCGMWELWLREQSEENFFFDEWSVPDHWLRVGKACTSSHGNVGHCMEALERRSHGKRENNPWPKLCSFCVCACGCLRER